VKHLFRIPEETLHAAHFLGLSLVGAFTAVMLFGCGGDGATGGPKTQSSVASASHWACPNGSGYKMYPAGEPARIVSDPDPISGTYL
jgi:hypothetical protein